jgi:2-polyprenyl-6-methoxyphenol hydroxylase-like FAD-dependent oxidoreductase
MTTSTEKNKHILIIGGGIAGKALALFLHKASTHPLSRNKFTCVIYEAYPPSEKIYIGGGLGLAPNGVAVLADLGLEDQIKKRTGLAKASRFLTEAGTQLGKWKHEGLCGTDMYGMMRSTLYDILSEELDAKGLKIEYKKRASKIEEKDNKVVVQFEDGSVADGDYIIGTDGEFLLYQANEVPNLLFEHSCSLDILNLNTLASMAPAASLRRKTFRPMSLTISPNP